jgi:hypothetical protein
MIAGSQNSLPITLAAGPRSDGFGRSGRSTHSDSRRVPLTPVDSHICQRSC